MKGISLKIIIFLFIISLRIDCIAQDKNIQTKISSKDTFELSIIKVYPINYPHVSVVFQARNKAGMPLWLLNKVNLKITENNQKCKILDLINISKNKPINIGLVFDHSGSMLDNPSLDEVEMQKIRDLYFGGLPIPTNHKMAIDFAKEGVNSFLDKIENGNDSILFVSFSDSTDKFLPLSNKVKDINSFLKEIEPSGSTAFYDALYLTIENLSQHSSNSAIVSLTDGSDNASKHTYQEVINNAVEKNIAVYIIGLGNIDYDILHKMSKDTKGFFYSTDDPNKLKEIYENIRAQLKSIYQIDYESSCEESSDNRSINFLFVNDTLTFSNNSVFYTLPEEVQSFLKEKENEQLRQLEDNKQKELMNNLLLGSILTVTLIGIGGFAINRRRQKRTIILNKVFPNPFNDNVSVSYFIPIDKENAELIITDLNGNPLHSFTLNKNLTEMSIDTSDLANGFYLFNILNGSERSNVIKALKI